MFLRRQRSKPFLFCNALIRPGPLFVLCLGAAVGASGAEAVKVLPPQITVHCLRDDGEIAFVLRWDYHFAYSSKEVSGFRIYRRVGEGDYSPVAEVSKSGGEANARVSQESVDRYRYDYTDDSVQPGKTYAYKVAAFDTAGEEAFNEVHIRSDPNADAVAGPENVLVVINSSCRESVDIGEYYRRQRGIPGKNLVRLPYEGNREILPMRLFETKIKVPIRDYLASEDIKEKILFIVVTYGLPYKIYSSGGKGADSVDATLVDLFDEYRGDPNLEVGPAGGRYRNPYFAAGSHFSRANGNRGYLVTRLDGPLAKPDDSHYNRETAHPDDPCQYLKNMVDKAIWAEENRQRLAGKGYFDRLFEAPWASTLGQGDFFINGAYDCCVALGFESVLDTTPRVFGSAPADSGGKDPLFCDDALWYAGWYSHFYKDAFGWAKGAVGFHIESWTAQSLRAEARYRGQSGWLWVPGMIRAGVTATMGPVDEPGLGGVPRIDWFFRYFFHGFCFAEAAYMASYSTGGDVVMIGDPLYNPFRANRLERTPPTITITSPKEGETVRGTKVLVEGTVDDSGITMLENFRPVRKGRFRYTEAIGTSEAGRARLPVIVGATDASGNTATASVTVDWVNVPPRLEAIPPLETEEGKTLAFTIRAADPDGDRLSYYFAVGSARPLGVSLNVRTGQFRWTPDFDQAGSYKLTFRVTDGRASDVGDAAITVRQAGSHPPKFLSPPENVEGTVGKMVHLELKAEDLDGDTLTFSAGTPLPDGARLVQSPPNRAVFLWEPEAGQVGSHKIVFTVSDGKGGRDTAALVVEIAPTAPPQNP
jgi:uncharacterized protein (TIGR03790 family)